MYIYIYIYIYIYKEREDLEAEVRSHPQYCEEPAGACITWRGLPRDDSRCLAFDHECLASDHRFDHEACCRFLRRKPTVRHAPPKSCNRRMRSLHSRPEDLVFLKPTRHS